MCLFTCGDSTKEESEIIVPVRAIPRTVIRAPTMPTTSSKPGSIARDETIVLKQISARNSPHGSRTSQTSYIVERRRSKSRSPRASAQQVVRVSTPRSNGVSPPLTPLSSGHGSRPGPGPLQTLTPGTSFNRVTFVESEPARLAGAILRSPTGQLIPTHRRSTSQVVVINRTPSQRNSAGGPRRSDSVLVHSGNTTYRASEVIAPSLAMQRPQIVEIEPRGSRVSQVSGGIVEIETAGGRRSRRQSNVQVITSGNSPRVSGTWRPREKYVLVDARGNKTEYYR